VSAPADSPGIARLERSLLPALARYFRLEVHGATSSIPAWDRQPCIFIMNHTAILGLEVYLLYAALQELRPGAPRPRTTVWPPFLDMPVLGSFYRAARCVPMSVEGAGEVLLAGESVLILPEGPDATDVRDELGPFHAGFLRVARKLAIDHGISVPIVPLGWAGVDEANPWWVTTHPLLVQALMKPFMPRFDFALLPRPPLLRPSKVVFVVGEPVTLPVEALATEPALREELGRMRARVLALVEQASAIREASIESSPVERALHLLTGSRRVRWRRRPLVRS
jgi:1-acyl-sn-glycerol-3-phosphate acyltransferase